MENKQSYFKNNIRRIFLLYAIIPVLLITFICLFVFWGAWRYSLEEITKIDNRVIAADLETAITSYMERAKYFAVHKNILDDPIDINTRVEIFESIYKIANSLGRRANLYVFDNEFKPVISSTRSIPSYLDGNYYENWGIVRKMTHQPDEIALKVVEGESSHSMRLLIGKAIIGEKKNEGYIILVMDSREFTTKIASLESQTIITDEFGWVYATNNYSFLDNLNRFYRNNEGEDDYIKNNLGSYYITTTSILNNQIQIHSISSLSSQSYMFRAISAVLFIVFSMMIIAVFISTKQMAAKKTKDIYEIIRAFEKVKEGNLDTYIDISSNDEFEIIGESYNLMLDSLKKQIETNEEMGRLLISSQTKQLETQFNPHFLYNTLENIRYMCRLNPSSASNMIYNLSKLLRYSINNVQEEVVVKEDIAYTKNYMSILRHRFNKRFQYRIYISKEIEQCIIPKLTIQPMIENSIKYGFDGNDSLKVEIRGYKKDGKLILVCSDNGSGINLKTLEEIRHILSAESNKTNHTGLFNIHRRIQLMYGEEYGVHLESEPHNGTVVSVVIPVKYRASVL